MALSKSWGITLIVVGAVQLLLALVVIICTSVIYTNVPIMFNSSLYAGFPYLLPGILAIVAGTTRKNPKNKYFVIAMMILNIVTSIFMYIVAIIMTMFSVLYGSGPVEGRCKDTASNGCDCGFLAKFPIECSKVEGTRDLTTAVAILCYLCCALSLGLSILGCANTCCVTCCPASSDEESTSTVTQHAMAPLGKGPNLKTQSEQPQGAHA